MDHPEEEANNKVPRRRAKHHPPISARDWLFEKETAERIGFGHSTLRGWRYEDEMRERQGLPWIGIAPRFYRKDRSIRYLKIEADRWIERHSGPDPMPPPPK
jgi:hypothetical protein